MTIDDRKKILESNLTKIRENIASAAQRSGRSAQDIKLMAVTKTVPPELINHAISLGINCIGENRVQELESKRPELDLDGTEVHIIGHLQTNKVKYVVGSVDMIESVDSVKLAEEISARSEKLGIVTPVLAEINAGAEVTKSGVFIGDAESFVDEIAKYKGIRVMGLMTIPPFDADNEKTRIYFKEIYKLFIDIGRKKSDNTFDMQFLSMGMSSDYETAIEEGANIVRIGSALFGARIYQH